MTTSIRVAPFNNLYLKAGTSWPTGQLTYSILTGMPYYYVQAGLFPDFSQFSGFTSSQIEAVSKSTATWATYANLTWTPVTQNNATQTIGQVTFGNYSFPANAKLEGRGFFPEINTLLPALGLTSMHSGDVWIAPNGVAPTQALQPTMGNIGFYLLLHEIGHALGLAHDGRSSSNEGLQTPLTFVTEDEADPLYTVMFYRREYALSNGPFPITPMMYDIAQIQRLYGPQAGVNVGSTSFTFGNDAGGANPLVIHPFADQMPQGSPYRDPGKVMMTLWDPDGAADKIDAARIVTPAFISLTPGTFSAIGTASKRVFNVGIALNPQGFEANRIEAAIGGSADDDLIGNDAANVLEGNGGADNLEGGPGADTLYGERAPNQSLNGAAGNDTLDGGVSLAALQAGSTTPGQGDGANDTLAGGAGHDTYVLREGGGVDHLIDTGENTLVFKNASDAVIETAPKVLFRNAGDATTGKNASGTITYTMNSPLSLTETSTGTQVVIDSFTEGDFGINLREAQAAHSYTAIGNTITGDETGNTLTGAAGADLIQAFGGNDTVNAGAEDDVVEAGDGNDFAYGEAGFDRLYGGFGNDQLYGGDGDDQVFGGADADILEGGAGYDRLAGEAGRDIVVGNEGDDEISADAQLVLADLANAITAGETQIGSGLAGEWLDGGEGEDVALGAQDNDLLAGGGGADVLIGAGGDDNLLGDDERTLVGLNWSATRNVVTVGNTTTYQLILSDASTFTSANGAGDELYGGAGADWLFGGPGDDYLDGGADNDVLLGQQGFDALFGGAGDDVMSGDDAALPGAQHGDDYLDGEDGNDLLFGNGGADELFGGAGNDTLYGDDPGLDAAYLGADYLDGEDGNDYLDGLGGADELFGGAGLDTLVGGAGDDYLDGEADNDLLAGGAGNDVLYGGLGADQLQGGSGDDQLDGGDDADVLFGDADDASATTQGNDLLDGGAGNDQIVGGGGADTMIGGEGDDQLWGDAEGLSASAQGADVMSGGLGNDYLRGYGGDDWMSGDEGNDTLLGQAGADDLSGGDGDDYLWGDDSAADIGNDTLDGGPGTDQLVGYAGNDTYVFGRGYGQDLVFDQDVTAGNIDRVEFAADISPDEVTAAHGPIYTGDLVLTITGTNDALTIANHFIDAQYQVEEIRFADGTVWTPSTTPLLIRGTTGSNVLTGTSGADVFEGLAGNDTMTGGAGNDTYRFYRGDGQDTITDNDSTAGNVDKILYATDILPSEVIATRSANNLVLAVAGTGDRVTVTNYFLNDGVTPYSVESIKFAYDGTVWDLNAVKPMVLTATAGNDTLIGYASDDALDGLAGNDTVEGAAGNDTLHGGTGADYLVGGLGDDTFLFNLGDGEDIISDKYSTAGLPGGGSDSLILGAGITPANVTATKGVNNELRLQVNGTSDLVRLYQYFGDDPIERIQFADGTVWTPESVAAMFPINGTSGNDILIAAAGRTQLVDPSGNNLFVDAGFGNYIDAGDQNDLVIGGKGDDSIHGDIDFDGVTGKDIVLYNRNDGADRVDQIGNATAISIGALTSYTQLKFDRAGTDFILKIGNQGMTMGDWYGNSWPAPNRVAYLQVMAESLRNYDPASTDPLYNRKVQVFDLLGLVAAFDQAQAAHQRFVVADHLAQFRVTGSDTQAYGGVVAYEYGVNGSVSALSYSTMRGVINAPEFGLQVQPIAGAAAPAFTESTSTELSVASRSTVPLDSMAFGADTPMAVNDTTADGVSLRSFHGALQESPTLRAAPTADAVSVGPGAPAAYAASASIRTPRDSANGFTSAAAAQPVSDAIGEFGLFPEPTAQWSAETTAVVAGVELARSFAPENGGLTLQRMLEAIEAFDADGNEPLDGQIEPSSTGGLRARVAAEGRLAQGPGLTSWARTNALLRFHLAGTDGALLGGDLSEGPGKNDALNGIGLTPALDVRTSADFTALAQQLRPLSGLQEGYAKLS